jgi:hypothetical protein
VIDLVSKAKHALVHKQDKIEDERAAKRSCLVEINNSCHSSDSEQEATTGSDGCNRIDEKNGDGATSRGPKPPQLAPGYNIWWDSVDAQRFFNASKERERL